MRNPTVAASPSEPSRLERVANLATRLAAAVIAGESETALALAAAVQDETRLRVVHLEAAGVPIVRSA